MNTINMYLRPIGWEREWICLVQDRDKLYTLSTRQ